MKPYYDDGKGIVIFHADARDVLPTLANESIDFIFTDPPYGHNNNNGDLIHRIEAVIPAGAACHWFDDTNKIENIIRHIHKIIPQATNHPTPKPVSLVEWFMRLHTKPGDLVLDCFAGGGSTVEAAKLNGLRCIAVECDERWCEMIARRLQQDVFSW